MEMTYDSPVFIVVQEGQIDQLRVILQSQPALLDAVDPYGLSLLYVGMFLRSWDVQLIELPSTQVTTVGEAQDR